MTLTSKASPWSVALALLGTLVAGGLGIAGVSAATAASAGTAAAVGVPVRIMTLGDSITGSPGFYPRRGAIDFWRVTTASVASSTRGSFQPTGSSLTPPPLTCQTLMTALPDRSNAKDLRAEAGGLHYRKGYIRPRDNSRN